MVKFPYAVREFEKMINGNYLFIDRTHGIRFMEEWGSELLFLRPRRFGKSLWLSMMMDYYDVAKADRFEQLFGHLAIGQDPTPYHNQYMVMRWDFSRVMSHGTLEEIEADLNECINSDIKDFEVRYSDMLLSPIEINPNNARTSFANALNAVQKIGYKLYLFIDEYDNFANEMMMSVQQGMTGRYESLMTGEGLFKTFFKNLKSYGSGRGLDRTFVTGVSPFVMNDATSGANVFEHVYWFQELNDICGFYEHEVADMLTEVVDSLDIPTNERASKHAEALDIMRAYYDGSWFTTEVPPPPKIPPALAVQLDTVQPGAAQPETPQQDISLPSNNRARQAPSRLYNPIMVFYLLRYMQRTGEYPDEMLDHNLQADRGKLLYISQYTTGRTLMVEGLNAQDDITVAKIGTDFGAKELLASNMRRDRLASLLCYLGALTISGRTDDRKKLLAIPNLVMKEFYAERILRMAISDTIKQDQVQVVIETLFNEGNLQPLCDFVEANLMSIYDNRDYPQFKELALKSLFIALLFDNNLYTIHSEPAVGRLYGDLLLWLKPDMHNRGFSHLLFEFKQISRNKVVPEKKGDEQEKRDESQPSALSGKEIRSKSRDELLAISIVKTELEGAKEQLRDYRRYLHATYGDELNLKTFAVVGVGLERIVWDEV
ncbi:MAG: AAA family ATPase [Chloroflexota bacterium]